MTENHPGKSEDQIHHDCKQRQKRSRSQRHHHIIALEAVMLHNALRQSFSIAAKYLIEALTPAKSLIPGLPEMNRLLIIQDCIFTVSDYTSLNNTVG